MTEEYKGLRVFSQCLQLDKRVILCPKLSPVVNLKKYKMT